MGLNRRTFKATHSNPGLLKQLRKSAVFINILIYVNRLVDRTTYELKALLKKQLAILQIEG